TARPGKSLDDIEKEINAEIERIKKDPPTADEMTRAKNSVESGAIFRLQTVLGKGSQLGSYSGFLNNPDYFQADLDRYARVTAADVQRVANTYLTPNRLVMSCMPRQGEAQRGNRGADRPTSVKSEKKNEALIAEQSAKLPKAGPNRKLVLRAADKTNLAVCPAD